MLNKEVGIHSAFLSHDQWLVLFMTIWLYQHRTSLLFSLATMFQRHAWLDGRKKVSGEKRHMCLSCLRLCAHGPQSQPHKSFQQIQSPFSSDSRVSSKCACSCPFYSSYSCRDWDQKAFISWRKGMEKPTHNRSPGQLKPLSNKIRIFSASPDKIGEQIRELFDIDINENEPSVVTNKMVSSYMKTLYQQLDNYENG